MTGQRIRVITIFSVLLVLIAITIPTVYVTIIDSTTIESTGSIKAIGVAVYWDSLCTDEVSSIDWSVIEAGSSMSKTVYIKNIENAVAILSMDTDNWSPSVASQYIVLDWDYGGQSINPDAVVEVVLTLNVSPDISGITDFSLDIIIITSG